MCRKKDRKAFIEKQAENKRKFNAVESKLDDAKEAAAMIEMSIREAKKEIDSEFSDGGSTIVTTPEEMAPGAKLLEQYPPPIPPNDESTSPSIKVENDDGTFSYDKWLESAREAGQITKGQKRGVAGIGSWVPVKWAAVNSKDEGEDNSDAATGVIEVDAHTETESSEFTLESLLAVIQCSELTFRGLQSFLALSPNIVASKTI